MLPITVQVLDVFVFSRSEWDEVEAKRRLRTKEKMLQPKTCCEHMPWLTDPVAEENRQRGRKRESNKRYKERSDNERL